MIKRFKKGKIYIVSMMLLLLIVLIGAAYVSHRQKNEFFENESSLQNRHQLFVCSMHPEVINSQPGDCPICGMSLIEKMDHSAPSTKMKFVCSMHREIIRDKAGECPICGMLLIEKMEQDLICADSSLTDIVRPVNVSVMASVATIQPVEENLPVVIESFGLINYDASAMHTISARFGGLIEQCFVKYQFQPISKGQKIYKIYSPNIYDDRWNYVRLIQMYPNQDSLTIEARNWIKLLGFTQGQLDTLKWSPKPDYHIMVYSEAEGYAVSADFDPEKYFAPRSNEEGILVSPTSEPRGGGIALKEGLTVETGTPLFKIINLKSLRADLKVRNEEAGLLKKGQKVIFTNANFPSQKIDGFISQIEPLNGGIFQLVKVSFKDREDWIKPGHQIQGQIFVGYHNSLWLPQSSIINMGQRQSVFVMHKGRFISTEIKTGLRSGDMLEVLSGIDPDSEIASNALLLTDSDSFIDFSQP